MKLNYYIESMPFCEIFSQYTIEEHNETRYLIPAKKSLRKQLSAEKNKEAMVEILNIGKKVNFGEEITDAELISFAEKYGLLGFMEDFSANKYYTISDNVLLRGCNFITTKDAIKSMDLIEYMKIFFPRIKDTQIKKKIKEANKIINSSEMEQIIIQNVDRELIFSDEYGEPIDMILEYAKILYQSLVGREISRINPIISNKCLGNEIHRIPTEYGVRFNYLKQGIDFEFLANITVKQPLLKICWFCKKAFLADNIKTEYDSHSCKNKANVYKTRGKFVKSEIVYEDGSRTVRILRDHEVPNTLRKKFNK